MHRGGPNCNNSLFKRLLSCRFDEVIAVMYKVLVFYYDYKKITNPDITPVSRPISCQRATPPKSAAAATACSASCTKAGAAGRVQATRASARTAFRPKADGRCLMCVCMCVCVCVCAISHLRPRMFSFPGLPLAAYPRTSSRARYVVLLSLCPDRRF